MHRLERGNSIFNIFNPRVVSLNKIFRRYCDTAIVLSVPALDKYARRFCEELLGDAPVKYLMDYSLAYRSWKN